MHLNDPTTYFVTPWRKRRVQVHGVQVRGVQVHRTYFTLATAAEEVHPFLPRQPPFHINITAMSISPLLIIVSLIPLHRLIPGLLN